MFENIPDVSGERPRVEGSDEILNEREKELARNIEGCQGISAEDKGVLILAWRGLKPATELEVGTKQWYEGEKIPQTTKEEEDALDREVEELLAPLHLAVAKGERIITKPTLTEQERKEGIRAVNQESKFFYVGARKEDVQRLAEILEAPARDDDKADAGEIGRLYGFPESAVVAYEQFVRSGSEEMLIDRSELPEDLLKQDVMAFAQFVLSKAHWREELETAKRWAEEVKRVSPSIYDSIVRAYRRDRW